MKDSVVVIESVENSSFGTGFVIGTDNNGVYILTCEHVLERVKNRPVIDGIIAEVKARGKFIDMAVLYVKRLELEALPLQDSKCTSLDVEVIGFSNFSEILRQKKHIDATLFKESIELHSKNDDSSYTARKIKANDDFNFDRGNSGSPVICKSTQKVIAMVSNKEGSSIGYAIDITHLKEVWKEDIPKKLEEDLEDNETNRILKDLFFIVLALIMIVTGVKIISLFYSNTMLDNNETNRTKSTLAEPNIPKPKRPSFSGPIPTMVAIKKGEKFTMGSDKGGSSELPPHDVVINYDFEIGKYEVTFEEYDYFCEQTGKKKPKDVDGKRGKYPVVNVSWTDTQRYINWLNEKTKKNYRLPSEAEWEYVARAGTDTKWSFGDDESLLEAHAWYKKNSNGKTHLVGGKEKNKFGVHDMYGNVWEWCEDWVSMNYYNTPTDGSANKLKPWGTKALRGGSWNNTARLSRSATRDGSHETDSHYNNYGFRILRTLP